MKYLLLLLPLFLLLDRGGIHAETTWILLPLSLLLLFVGRKQRQRRCCKWTCWGDCFLLAGAVLSAAVGIDRGESIYGAVKLLTVLAVSCWLRRLTPKERDRCLNTVPFLGIGMLGIGVGLKLLMFLSGINGAIGETAAGRFAEWLAGQWFSDTGRFAGAFFYPNAAALFFLVGFLLAENVGKVGKRVLRPALLAGILWSGSRAVFAVSAMYALYRLIRSGREGRILCLMVAGAAGGIGLLSAMGVFLPSAGRFLSISLNAGTFQGRLLYWEDACRMLFKYPLGLGYMGYFYLQRAMQTGVYNVRFVHNDWLQLLLDYGVLAGIGAVLWGIGCCRGAAGKTSAKDGRNADGRLRKLETAAVILLCSFWDFQLQFWGILFWLLVLLAELEAGSIHQMQESGDAQQMQDAREKKRSVPGRILWAAAIVGAAGIGCMQMIVFCYAKQGAYEKALFWNPLSTEYRLERLLCAESPEEAEALADEVLSNNAYVYAAYRIKANAAANRKDPGAFIRNAKAALRLQKYNPEEYEDYAQILCDLYEAAKKENDSAKIQLCTAAMQELPKLVEQVKKETSVRAFRLADKPQLYLTRKTIRMIGGKWEEASELLQEESELQQEEKGEGK